MPVRLSERAEEGSTYVVRFEFYEKTPSGKVPITPKAGLKWNLVDQNRNPINGRTNVGIAAAQTVDVVLFGLDLSLSNASSRRFITMIGTYDSYAGNDMPLVTEAEFHVSDLKGKS